MRMPTRSRSVRGICASASDAARIRTELLEKAIRPIAERLEERQLLTQLASNIDLTQLGNQVQQVLQPTQGSLNMLLQHPMPIVGTELPQAVQTLSQIGADFASAFVNANQNDLTDIENLLSAQLGPNGTVAHILNFSDSDVTQTLGTDPMTGQPAITELEFSIPLNQVAIESNSLLDFNTGLPSLGLTVTTKSSVQVAVGFTGTLDFVIDGPDFFLNTAKTNLQINTIIDLIGSTYTPTSLSGDLNFLTVTATDHRDNDGYAGTSDTDGPTGFDAVFTVSFAPLHGAPTLLPLSDINSGDLGLSATLSGTAQISLDCSFDFGSYSYFPSMDSLLLVEWPFENAPMDAAGSLANFGYEPTVSFDDVSIDLGSFFDKTVAPIIKDVKSVLDWAPLQDILNFFNSPMPIINDFGSAAQAVGLSTGGGPITILDVLDKVDPSNSILRYLTDIETINSFASEFSASTVNGVDMISMGSFQLGGNNNLNLGSADLRTLTNLENVALTQVSGTALSQLQSDVVTYGASLDNEGIEGFLPGLAMTLDTPNGWQTAGNTIGASFDDNGGINFPILSDPATGFSLLLGQQVNLMAFQMPTFNLDASLNVAFELGPLQLALHGNLNNALGLQTNNAFMGTASLSGGYDTLGAQEFVQPGAMQGLGSDFGNGFYLNSLNSGINVVVGAEADLDLNAGIAEAGVAGGISGSFNFTLNPANTNDGRLRFSDILADLNAGDLFLVSGEVDASFFAFVQIGVSTPFGFVGYQHNFTIASTVLFSFGQPQNTTPVPTTVTVTDSPSGNLKEDQYTEFNAVVGGNSSDTPVGNVTFDIMLNGVSVDQVTELLVNGQASAGPIQFSTTGAVTCTASYTPSAHTPYQPSTGDLNQNSVFGEQQVVGTIFVDSEAQPGGDGSSFARAYNTIDQALDVAAAGDIIAVAAGLYLQNTIDLPYDVTLVGGFSGIAGALPAPNLYETVLETEPDSTEPVLYAGSADNSSTVLDGFVITGGSGVYGGGINIVGSGIANGDGSPLIENCTFVQNGASAGGGAVYCDADASPTFVQCLFTENGSASSLGPTTDGGAIFSTGVSSPSFINCTITNNDASGNGTAIDNQSGNLTLTNCIVWNDGRSQEIYTQPNLTTNTIVSYSDVEQAGYANSNGNILSNPNFADPDPAFYNPAQDPYELTFPSACINTGLNSAIDSFFTTDLAGNKRVFPIGGGVDIGAFEYQGPSFTLFVDHTASGRVQNGSNWDDAFLTLQQALAVAGPGDTIDVAEGTYTPGTSTSSTFKLLDDMTIQGGYASGGSAGPNPQLYVTILDGALGNRVFANHVVTVTDTGSSSLLEGFTIENGSALNSGTGGGLLDTDSSPKIEDCVFLDNSASALGGAIYNVQGSSPQIINCIFTGNSAGLSGGAISNENGSSPLILNSVFSSNTALLLDGGAIENDTSSSPTISNCTFTQNTAYQGGAIESNSSSTPTVINSILWNDVSTDVPADNEIYGPAAVAACDVSGGHAGFSNISANPLFNSSTEFELQNGSPAIGAGAVQDAADEITATGVSTDLAGNPRITSVHALPPSKVITSTVDLGAYEYQGATSLVFGGSPPLSVTAGNNFAYAVYVNLEQNGHLVSNDNSTVTLSIASGPTGATLGGVLQSTVHLWQAQFTNLFISGPAGTYTLEATDGGDIPATSHSFTITVVNTTLALQFIQQPTNVAENTAISPSVQLGVYLNGTLDTADSASTVSLSVGSNVVATAPVNSGVATFSNLVFTSTGTFALTASDGTDATVISASFTVSLFLPPPVLTVGPSPVNGMAGVNFSQPITATLTQNGSPLANGSTVNLQVLTAPLDRSVDSNTPVYGTLTGSLQATVNSNGVATFTGLAATVAGAYLIEAYDGSAISEMGFNVTQNPGADHLVFTQQPYSFQLAPNVPVPTFTVTIENPAGGVDTLAGGGADDIAISVVGSNQLFYPGTITQKNASSSVASFSNIYLPDAGQAILLATDLSEPSVIVGYSNTFTIEAGAAYSIGQATIPQEIAGSTFSLPVNALDENRNIATSYSGNPVFTLAGAPSGIPLGSTYNSTFVGGMGIVSNIVEDAAGTYTLQSDLGDVSFTIVAGAANRLAFLEVPAVLSAGAKVSPAITVAVEDRFGNMVTIGDSPITLSVDSPAGAQLSGVVTVDAVDGIATFDQVYTSQLGSISLMAQDQTDGISSTISSSITVAVPGTMYVDQNAAGAGTGQDWEDAFTTLQSALAVSIAGDTIDIAQGDYSPGSDATDTFQLIDGVTIQGGYQSGGSDLPDPSRNPTILDGSQINYNVVTADGTDSSALLEDVTITGGNASGDGTGDDDSYYGAGLLADGGSPTITDCTFTDNSATAGGAIYIANSTAAMTISGCIFTNNIGTGFAGAIYTSGASVTVINSHFTGNSATGIAGGADAGAGGAVADNGDSAVWVDCLFASNTAANYGGAMYFENASPQLTNCTFSQNTVTNENYENTLGGGAIDCELSSTVTLTNCILWNDSANSNTGAVESEISTDASNPSNPTSTVGVNFCDVDGGYAGSNNLDVDPFFVDSTDSDYELLPTSPCINAGSNVAPGLGTFDLAGDARIVGSNVDMGAYEAQSAEVFWTGADDGIHWNDPGNWSDDVVPSQNDDVTISAGFNTVLVTSGSYFVNSLVTASPIEITSGDSLFVNAFSDFINGLTIDDGGALINTTTASSTDPGPLVVYNLNIISGGTLDIGAGEMVVQGGSLSAVTSEIALGYKLGAWTGSGITSSAAAADLTHLTAVGAILNNDGLDNPLYGSDRTLGLFDGYSPSLNDVLVKYTYYGDANLDGNVNSSDYTRVDAGFLGRLAGWSNGDFNYDGVINGSDYTLIDNAFNTQGASLAAQISSPSAMPTAESASHLLNSESNEKKPRPKTSGFVQTTFASSAPLSSVQSFEESIEGVMQKKDLIDSLEAEQ